MHKKKIGKKSTAKGSTKKPCGSKDASPVKAPAAAEGTAGEGHLIRAIRIRPSVLAAAKAYKKDGGPSFYQLGEQAIEEVLREKGYLKEPVAK